MHQLLSVEPFDLGSNALDGGLQQRRVGFDIASPHSRGAPAWMRCSGSMLLMHIDALDAEWVLEMNRFASRAHGMSVAQCIWAPETLYGSDIDAACALLRQIAIVFSAGRPQLGELSGKRLVFLAFVAISNGQQRERHFE